MSADRPWLKWYGSIPPTLDYPPGNLSQALMATVARVPDAPAFEFLGHRASCRQLGKAIDRRAGGARPVSG